MSRDETKKEKKFKAKVEDKHPDDSSRGESKMTLMGDGEIPSDKVQWIKEIYSTVLYNDQDLTLLYDEIKYQGFNRDRVLTQVLTISADKKVIVKIIVACALRGPKVASELKMVGGKSLKSIGVPASGGKGKDNLTCNKIQAATADLAAYYLKKLNVPKRIESNLPGWLQFPSAGSIRMPEELRALHREFSKRFSQLIGGEFNEQIYQTMTTNSYLDENLKLFT